MHWQNQGGERTCLPTALICFPLFDSVSNKPLGIIPFLYSSLLFLSRQQDSKGRTPGEEEDSRGPGGCPRPPLSTSGPPPPADGGGGCLPTQNLPWIGCVSWVWPGSFQSESGRDSILTVVPLLLPGAPALWEPEPSFRATGGTGGSQTRGEPGPPLLQAREAL